MIRDFRVYRRTGLRSSRAHRDDHVLILTRLLFPDHHLHARVAVYAFLLPQESAGNRLVIHTMYIAAMAAAPHWTKSTAHPTTNASTRLAHFDLATSDS